MRLIFRQEPTDQAYVELIDVASTICSDFILVKRDQLSINDNALRVLKELHPYLKEKREQESWPGTRFAPTAAVYYYLLNDESKEILQKHAAGLYSWVQPDLPEDLSFIKSNGKAWLSNTAHERVCYIETDDATELEKVKSLKGIKVEER